MLQVNNLIGFGARRAIASGPPATSYANSGGTGNRTSTITISGTASILGGASNLVNGSTTDTSAYLNSGIANGDTIVFDFGAGAAKYIDEIKWYQSSATANGTWKFEGSNDNSSYTELATGLALGTSATTTLSFTPAAYSLWRYFRLVKTGGSSSPAPWVHEIEFKISA